MLKRSLLFAGVAGASLLAAAEPAANTPNAANANAPVVTEEETVTIVAVPCSVGPGKCADVKPACADAKQACADKKKECPDKKECADKKKECAGKKDCTTAAAPDYSDDDYQLAYTLMEAGGVPMGIDDANGFIIMEQMEQAPMLKPAQPAFEKFFRDHCSYQAMKRDLARIHLETFTRDEMRKIIDFFNTPEGKKLAASQADLSRRTLALRADRIHRNFPELQKNVHNCMVQAQQNNTNSANTAAAAK